MNLLILFKIITIILIVGGLKEIDIKLFKILLNNTVERGNLVNFLADFAIKNNLNYARQYYKGYFRYLL